MIRYIKVGDTHKVDTDSAAKTHLRTYYRCPRCGCSNPKIDNAMREAKVKHHGIHVYNKWHLGLFRTTHITTGESWCESCGTKWREDRIVKGELAWRPIWKCIIYWIIMLVSLCVLIPTMAWCIHVAGLPMEERDVTNGKFSLVFIPGLIAMFFAILSIVRIAVATYRRNQNVN